MRTRRSLRDSDSQANSPIDTEDEDEDQDTRSAASDAENIIANTSPTMKKTPSVSRGRTGKTGSAKKAVDDADKAGADPMDFVR